LIRTEGGRIILDSGRTDKPPRRLFFSHAHSRRF
jgi:hypothetical protein